MDQLRDSIGMLTAHSAECGGKCTLEGETMHSGLAVIMQASCAKCGHVFSIKTSPRAQTSNGKQWTVNLGAVLGELSTGGGLTRLNSTLALMDVPGMHKRMYSNIEEFLGKEMRVHLAHSMQQAAEEEKQHTIETNTFPQGIPSITVGRKETECLTQCKRPDKGAYWLTLYLDANGHSQQSSTGIVHKLPSCSS